MTDEDPATVLSDLVERYGPSLAEDPRKTAALLRDLCGERRLEISLIEAAAEEGAAVELRDLAEGIPPDAKLAQLTQRLERTRGLTTDNARFAVEAWANALGTGTASIAVPVPDPGHEITAPTEPRDVTNPQDQAVLTAVPWWKRRAVWIGGALVLVASVAILLALVSRHHPIVKGLAAASPDGGEVHLTWTPPTSGAEGVRYSISRDGQPLATVASADGEYLDSTVVPASAYTYEVVALDSSGALKSDPASIRIHTPLAPAPDLAAVAVSGGEIRLSWNAPGSGNEDLGYVISRNGAPLDSVRASTLSYRDLSVSPQVTYAYEVTAVDDSSVLRSAPATITVATPAAPPVADAIVRGRWTITGSYLDETYDNVKAGDAISEAWRFGPCISPGCQIKLYTDQRANPILRNTGGERKGTGSFRFTAGPCSSTETDTVVVKVKHAEFHRGVWTATRIEGSIHESAPETSCLGATYGDITYGGTPNG